MSAPGQVFYEASRKSILRGADGIVFVTDSQIPLLDANLESFDGLRRNCLQNDIDLLKIPLVFQYNKRDLNYLIPVETFNNLLNPRRMPWIEAVAVKGVGVFEALRKISKLTVPVVRDRLFGAKTRQEPEAAPFPPPPPGRSAGAGPRRRCARRPAPRPASWSSRTKRSRTSSISCPRNTSANRSPGPERDPPARSSPLSGPMLYKIASAALLGIEAYVVEVEVDIGPGLPDFITSACRTPPSGRARSGSGRP